MAPYRLSKPREAETPKVGWRCWLMGQGPAMQLLRYSIVGASGLVIALASLNGVMVLADNFVTANVVSFLLAVTWNFALNRRFTFRVAEGSILYQWVSYTGGCLAGTAINWVVSLSLYYGTALFHDHYNGAALIGVACASGFNFLWARRMVFGLPCPHASTRHTPCWWRVFDPARETS